MKILNFGLWNPREELVTMRESLSKMGEYREIAWTMYKGEYGLNKLNLHFAKTVAEFKPDVIFMQVQNDAVLDLEVLKFIKEKFNPFMINWTGDVRHPVPDWYLQVGRIIDLTLFTNVNDVLECRRRGITADYLQIGYNHNVYKPEGEVNEAHEVLFMGNNYLDNKYPLSDYRKEMAIQLKNTYGEKFGIYGGGWDGYASGMLMGKQEEEANIYRGAQMGINCSHFEYSRYSSDRIFRILGCGALCLTKYFPDLEKEFTNGENVVVWNDFGELVTKINYYLHNQNEGKTIARAGAKLALETATWDKRIEQLNLLMEKHGFNRKK